MRKSKLTTEDKLLRLEKENILNSEEENNEKKNIKRFILFFIIFLVLLYFSTFGITVSFYKGGSNEPQIIDIDPADEIIFTYSDVDKSGNGINIINAMPMDDARGKVLLGTGNYFDFSVTATSKQTNLVYKILIRKDNASTLANSNVRIYLTQVTGSYEQEVVLTTFDNLEKTTINGVEYYVLSQKRLSKGINNYSDFYRLRMWVKEDATDYNDKTFMLKVDVTAEQDGD